MNFASGLTSGLIGALAVTPMDCVKTRIQKQGGMNWLEAGMGIYSEGYAVAGHSGAIQGMSVTDISGIYFCFNFKILA